MVKHKSKTGDEGNLLFCIHASGLTDSPQPSGITIRGRFWKELMAGDLCTSLERIPVAGRLRRLVSACKNIQTNKQTTSTSSSVTRNTCAASLKTNLAASDA